MFSHPETQNYEQEEPHHKNCTLHEWPEYESKEVVRFRLQAYLEVGSEVETLYRTAKEIKLSSGDVP